MKNNEPATLAFDFQPIKLEEIPRILPPTHSGKYSQIRIKVLEHIATLPPGESFILAPSKKSGENGALDKNARASFCGSINKTLRSERMPWHMVYSGIAKAFVIAPLKHRGYKQRVLEKQEVESPENSKTGFQASSDERLEKLVKLTCKTFGVTLKELQKTGMLYGKNYKPERTDIKRAMVYVGKNGLGLKLTDIGRILGISSGTTTPYCQQAMIHPESKKKVELLSAALNKE